MIDDLALAAAMVVAVVIGACVGLLFIEKWIWRE